MLKRFVLGVVLVIAGCGGTDGNGDVSPDSKPMCTEGKTEACACPGTTTPGAQTCGSGGTWGSCDCGGGDASGGGTAGSGGTAGATAGGNGMTESACKPADLGSTCTAYQPVGYHCLGSYPQACHLAQSTLGSTPVEYLVCCAQ